METFEYIKKFLLKKRIELCSSIPLSAARIPRPYKLIQRGFSDLDSLNAVMIAVPYAVPVQKRNISSYAVSRDYHLFFKMLFEELIPLLEEKFPDHKYAGFADTSPIDEIDAAARCGLGIIGENKMLITEKYSSYVFIGEIITDAPIPTDICEIKHCCSCGACRVACPMNECSVCLSSLTQKKGELDEKERELIRKYNTAWGCDICQEACPHTKKALENHTLYTEISFFHENIISEPTVQTVLEMSKEEFDSRAYSWRGRQTILRNLALLEEKKGI